MNVIDAANDSINEQLHITELLETATFICNSNGKAVWEVANMNCAEEAIIVLGATPYNWCGVQQPNGPVNRKPRIAIRY